MSEQVELSSTMEWARLNAAFDEVYALDASERAAAAERLCGDDPSLLVELQAMLEAAEASEQAKFLGSSILPTPGHFLPDAEDSMPEFIGSYRIEKEIGRGGMGLVYLATHPEINRKVAVKVIKRGMDTDEIVRRFRLERHLLATLDHPNIARLLDGGTTADGRPYFVLEYVDGLPVTEYCDKNRLGVEDRLAIFSEICSAVSYAHRHLVIHRDIKPTNIIVDSTGRPKLLDFGISKLLDPAGPGFSMMDTAVGMRLLTPEYASPEQLQGKTVSTASDIYSLGVLLYELLSGRRPIRLEGRPLDEFSRALSESEPPAPSTAMSRPQTLSGGGQTGEDATAETLAEHRGERPDRLRCRLRGDLDNIVLMALRKEPDRRYGAVEQFAEDISRHLSGLPVMARPASIGYVAAKFARRHRPQVAAAGAALIAIFAAFGVALWQAKVATDEKNRAEERFTEVRRLSNLLITGWDEGLGEASVSHEARARLADISAGFLDNLTTESEDATLLKDLGEAHIKLGHEYAYQLIDTAKASAHLDRSEAIARRLVAAHPNEVSYKDLLVRALLKKDEFFGHTDLKASLANRLERLELRRQILETDAPTELTTRGYAQALADAANGYADVGETANAEDHFHRAIAAFRQRIDLLSTQPSSFERDTKIASSYSSIADHYGRQLGDFSSTLAAAERAFEASERAYLSAPEDHGVVVVYTMTGFGLGQAREKTGDLPGALAAFERVVAASRKMNSERRIAYLARKEYDAYLELADLAHLSGETTKALEFVRLSDDARGRWLAADSHRERGRSIYGSAFHLTMSGKLLVSMGRTGEGRARLLKAAETLEELSRREPLNNFRSSVRLAAVYLTIADVDAGLGVCSPKQRPFGGVTEQIAYCNPGSAGGASRIAVKAEATEFYRRAERIYGELETAGMLTARESADLALARDRLGGARNLVASRE